ncbi:plasmid recombination protein, partial [Bacillus altitudinis]|uniref:MobV family relaxase n=1 Tax=Bacillus altitudinis TaxID=293387 RepID=UPI0013EE6A55
MSYAVLHMQKLKQTAIKGIQIHNQREKESQTNGDIDRSRSHLNYDLVNSKPIDYSEKINKMIEERVTTGKAIRKDAVKVASFLVTSDSEYFQKLSPREERRFFESAYEFFVNEYGEKNIAYAMVHKDEKTPHMHVGFVPITEDGRLSAKDFFGKKQQLVKLQDKFHDHMVREGFDLERGVSSDRKHVETAKYKALTFQQMEQEAREKYERTMRHIQEIDDKTKAIENIQPK